MSKQSSIEWLVDQLVWPSQMEKIIEVKKQAKAMHQKEIEDAYIQSMKDNMIAPLDFEVYKPEADEYYNETFGGNNE